MKDQFNASKRLSYILRHRPESAGIRLDNGGWADVLKILEVLKIPMADLEKLVETNDKQRFAFNEDKTKIRANQGHSINVNLDLKPMAVVPDVLYHGTTEDVWDSIKKKGLQKMNRQHVHLSADVDTALLVGNRRKREVILLQIHARLMVNRGHKFYLSENNVWLTDHVPPKYIALLNIKKIKHA